MENRPSEDQVSAREERLQRRQDNQSQVPEVESEREQGGQEETSLSASMLASLLERLRALEEGGKASGSALTVKKAVDPSLEKLMDPNTYRLKRRGAMSSADISHATFKEGKMAIVKLMSTDSLSVLEFLADFRVKADQAQIVEEHGAQILPTLIAHPFVSGEIQTRAEDLRREEGGTTFKRLVEFLLSTYVTEDSVLEARRSLYLEKALQNESVEMFAARLRKQQNVLQGSVSEESLKKTLLKGLSPQLQLFADKQAVENNSFAQLVVTLSRLQRQLEIVGTSTGTARTNASILRRHQTDRNPSVSVLTTEEMGDENETDSVSLLSNEDMKSWICAGCRHFGHATWLCPFLPEEVRLQSKDLRMQQTRRNKGRDPMTEHQSKYRLDPRNQVPLMGPAYPNPNPQIQENENGKKNNHPPSSQA